MEVARSQLADSDEVRSVIIHAKEGEEMVKALCCSYVFREVDTGEISFLILIILFIILFYFSFHFLFFIFYFLFFFLTPSPQTPTVPQEKESWWGLWLG